MTISVGDAFAARENNFDLIRLSAAFLVLASHSFPLTRSPELFGRFIGYATGGGLAVAVFFTISGFLVTRSALSRSLPSYIAARGLRIFPALIVLTLLQMFVLGPLFTSLTTWQYLTHPQTWRHLGNAGAFWISFPLPGVFLDNPYRASVNGSLWTLPLETLLYLLLPIALLCGGITRYGIVILAVAVMCGALVGRYAFGLTFENFGGLVAPSVPMYRLLDLGSFFVLGSAFWIWRDAIPLSWPMAALLATVAALSFGGPLGSVAYTLTVVYSTFVLALRTPPVRLARDISYGVYLYAFPLQQSLVAAFGGKVSPWLLTAICVPIVSILGYLSARFVEEPTRRIRKRTTSPDEREVTAR